MPVRLLYNLGSVQSRSEKDPQEAAGNETHYLREAARRLFARQHSFNAAGVSSGFSGSAFARVETSGRSWCLGRWPLSFEERRLRFIHRVLSESRTHGFTGVPELARTQDGETVLTLAGRLYDAQEWLAGEPLSGAMPGGEPSPNVVVPLSPARITSLATALARFHRSTAHFCEGRNNTSLFLARLAQATEARHEALRSEVQSRAEGEERHVALRWLELLPETLAAARKASETFSEEASGEYVVCHGDLWPAHVHFDGDAFVGFTDFESLCFAAPALDLAQLILHFGRWEMRENVLQSYETVAPLAERDRSMLPVEAVVDLADEGYWSLEAVYGDTSSQTTSAQRAAHMLNLREVIGSLERTAEEVRRIGG
jgi:Ser/Thr protein kinase RdoA (MazF antagonist)